MSQIAQDAVTSETSGTGPEDTTSTTDTNPQPPAPEVSAPSTSAQPEPKMFDETYVKQLRDEAAGYRTKAKEAEQAKKTAAEEAKQSLAQQIGKAIGLVADDAPPNPDDLLKQLSGKDSELRQSRVELALYRAAAKAGADADALLDSRSFLSNVDKLDVTSDTFSADLASVIKQAVEANPKLATATGPVPPRSGGEITGGSGERHNTNPEDESIEDHRKARRKRRGIE